MLYITPSPPPALAVVFLPPPPLIGLLFVGRPFFKRLALTVSFLEKGKDLREIVLDHKKQEHRKND
ncbi:hypothetical protein [Persephonella hydrogeniphila]|uniref:hypothetical protein n=1 Tax=Persephonella hydrogeniphila TaxID=198703 RepID=UPI0011800127|nr:hypothetical protein [Persephonella hydrogeniphila]